MGHTVPRHGWPSFLSEQESKKLKIKIEVNGGKRRNGEYLTNKAGFKIINQKDEMARTDLTLDREFKY